jgi:hypothetical protein
VELDEATPLRLVAILGGHRRAMARVAPGDYTEGPTAFEQTVSIELAPIPVAPPPATRPPRPPRPPGGETTAPPGGETPDPPDPPSDPPPSDVPDNPFG